MATINVLHNSGVTFSTLIIWLLSEVLAANLYKKTGSLIEKYSAAMKDLIFTPLGMKDTVIQPEVRIKPLMAFPHALDFNGRYHRVD